MVFEQGRNEPVREIPEDQWRRLLTFYRMGRCRISECFHRLTVESLPVYLAAAEVTTAPIHTTRQTERIHRQEKYLPPSRPYELVHLMLDLIHLARWMLVRGGRLVFFLPTISAEYEGVDIPVVEGMRELKSGEGSVQDFGRWGRRVSGPFLYSWCSSWDALLFASLRERGKDII